MKLQDSMPGVPTTTSTFSSSDDIDGFSTLPPSSFSFSDDNQDDSKVAAIADSKVPAIADSKVASKVAAIDCKLLAIENSKVPAFEESKMPAKFPPMKEDSKLPAKEEFDLDGLWHFSKVEDYVKAFVSMMGTEGVAVHAVFRFLWHGFAEDYCTFFGESHP